VREPEPRAVRVAQRDRLIRELASVHYSHLARSAQAKRIAELVASYAGNGWPRDRGNVSLPAHLGGKPERLLWMAFKLDVIFPFSARQIERIL
jgi:hypothetical protein